MSSRPVILCVVDRPRWAHDRKTDALARALEGEFEIRKCFQQSLSAEEVERADCVLFYYWWQIGRVSHLRSIIERRRDRVMVGICSHAELEREWREPGLATLRTLPRAVFVNSRLLLEEFAPQLGLPIYYTPNGVDTRFFRPAPLQQSRTSATLRVGWAGSLANQGPEHRGVRDFIVPAVEAMGGELCMAVREEKWRGLKEMLEFYHSIDVYVCASRTEGTPNPCLEAAACGIPVVTTRVGNMPELIRDGENGYFVEREVSDIAGKLAALRDDPELRLRLGRAARADVLSWDWRRQAVRYGAMFRDVLEG